jgi:hypothetical protein
VAKPVKHRGKWRIRWFDENDHRQSEVHDDDRVAQVRLASTKSRSIAPPRRSGKHDENVFRKDLGAAFETMRVRDTGVEDGDASLRSHTERLLVQSTSSSGPWRSLWISVVSSGARTNQCD